MDTKRYSKTQINWRELFQKNLKQRKLKPRNTGNNGSRPFSWNRNEWCQGWGGAPQDRRIRWAPKILRLSGRVEENEDTAIRLSGKKEKNRGEKEW